MVVKGVKHMRYSYLLFIVDCTGDVQRLPPLPTHPTPYHDRAGTAVPSIGRTSDVPPQHGQ